MALYMPKPNDNDFAPPPAGTHPARCYRVVDLGTQQVNWQGEVKHQHKVMISWELPTEKMEDGQPFSIHQRYTFSSSEKARLRKDLESWRGKKFTEADFGPGGFHIKKLLGVPCLLSVVHTEKNDRTYANISAISAPMKDYPVPEQINQSVFLSLDPEEFDAEVFRNLSDSLRDVIRKSPEYQEIEAKSRGNGNGYEAPHDGIPDLDDDIPF